MGKIVLSKISTRPPRDISKKETILKMQEYVNRIGGWQQALYAAKDHALLVIFQGMDGSGKDSAIRNVFAACSPMGLSVYSFKKPIGAEIEHDFLWRVHRRAPEKGFIQIFSRSQYEDVLIQRVHGGITKERAQWRMKAINAFEDLLMNDNNTTILKFYLHISKNHQKQELQERRDDPKKQWKHDPDDWEERKFWQQYMNCYEDALDQSALPWHVVPADKKWYRDYVISKIICKTLETMNLKFPKLDRSEK